MSIKNMTRDEFAQWMIEHEACETAKRWVEDLPETVVDAKGILAECPRYDWLLWAAYKLGLGGAVMSAEHNYVIEREQFLAHKPVYFTLLEADGLKVLIAKLFTTVRALFIFEDPQ